MKGQLWQDCPVCGREPVCTECQRCECHCVCARPRVHPPVMQAPEPYRRGLGQGFGPKEDADAEG